MAEHIAEVIFIDMERSEIDEERSRPTKGIYFFKGEPELITNDSYKHADTCPDFVYKWGRHTEDGRSLNKWINQYGWDFVNHGEDKIYPQGAQLDADGHWQFGDGVLMKIPLEVYMKRKAREQKAIEDAQKAVRGQFRADVAASDPKLGKGAVLTEEELKQYLSDEDTKFGI